MRAALPAVALLLLAAGLAGCFERNGTLAIVLAVDPTGHVDDFRSLNVSMKDVRVKARTLNLEAYPSAAGRVELVQAANSAQRLELFRQQVRADTYERIELTTTSSAAQGYLADGTQVGVVVPNGAIILANPFDLPRGGTVVYTVTVTVDKVDTGTGAPTYTVIPSPAASGPSPG